jgi:hypothetical protein
MTFVRPGPASIEPGGCPGGVVLYIYEVPSQRLLFTQRIDPFWNAETLEATAEANADAAHREAREVCIVTYDGDTGDRIIPDGFAPGRLP